jgi:cell division protein FtsB
MLNKIQNYRDLVLTYENLNAQIDQLLMATHGGTEQMTTDQVAQYRDLARQRDEMHNQIRWLEQQLLDEDTIH